MRKNEWLSQILNIGNMFGQLLVSKIHSNFNVRNTIYSPHINLTTQEKFTPLYTSLDLSQNLLSDQLWTPLLYNESKQVEG